MTHSKQVYKGLASLGDAETLKLKFLATHPEAEDSPEVLQELFEEAVPEEEGEDEESLELENQRLVATNTQTIELLSMVVNHAHTYDSLDTALTLLGKAYRLCPSLFVKRTISAAGKSLKAAIKTDQWMRSKRRRQHVDEFTRKKNLDTFYERLADATTQLQQYSDKHSKKLFKNIKRDYRSELPTKLTRGAMFTHSHVVVMATRQPQKYKTIRLEGGLFMVQSAYLLGINTDKVKKPLLRAQQLAGQKGLTVHEQAIPRPAHNITWFLILDFGSAVSYVSFADTLELYEDTNRSNSYEDFVRARDERETQQQQIKTQRLRQFREKFVTDNNLLFEERRLLRAQLDNVRAQLQVLDQQFAGLTMTSEQDPGLKHGQYARLYDHLQQYLDNLLREGNQIQKAALLTLQQRVEARTKYYERVELAREGTGLSRQLKLLDKELDFRKAGYARELGLVSVTKTDQLEN